MNFSNTVLKNVEININIFRGSVHDSVGPMITHILPAASPTDPQTSHVILSKTSAISSSTLLPPIHHQQDVRLLVVILGGVGALQCSRFVRSSLVLQTVSQPSARPQSQMVPITPSLAKTHVHGPEQRLGVAVVGFCRVQPGQILLDQHQLLCSSHRFFKLPVKRFLEV